MYYYTVHYIYIGGTPRKIYYLPIYLLNYYCDMVYAMDIGYFEVFTT